MPVLNTLNHIFVLLYIFWTLHSVFNNLVIVVIHIQIAWHIIQDHMSLTVSLDVIFELQCMLFSPVANVLDYQVAPPVVNAAEH